MSKNKTRCLVPQCNNCRGDTITMHLIPQEILNNKKRREEWMRVLKIKDSFAKDFKICSEHFKAKHLISKTKKGKFGTRQFVHLSNKAFPTKKLPKSTSGLKQPAKHLREKLPKRKRLRNDSPVKIVNEPILDDPNIISSDSETDIAYETEKATEHTPQNSNNHTIDANEDEETVVLASTVFADSSNDAEINHSESLGNSSKKRQKYTRSTQSIRISPKPTTDDGLLIESEFSQESFNMEPHEDVTDSSSDHRRERRNLNKAAVATLKDWLYKHRYNAYPSEADKKILANETGLTALQVANWFINARRRLLPEFLKREGITLGKDKIAFIIKKRRMLFSTTEEKQAISKNKTTAKNQDVVKSKTILETKPIENVQKLEKNKENKTNENEQKQVKSKENKTIGNDQKLSRSKENKTIENEEKLKRNKETNTIENEVKLNKVKEKIIEKDKKLDKNVKDDLIKNPDSNVVLKSKKLDKITETAMHLKEKPIKIALSEENPETEITKRETIYSSTQDGIRHVIGHKIINLGTGKVIKLEIYSKPNSKSKTGIENKGTQKTSNEIEKKARVELEGHSFPKTSNAVKDPLQIEPEDVRIFSKLNASEPESNDTSDKEVIVLENTSENEVKLSKIIRKNESTENLKKGNVLEKKNNSSIGNKDSDEKTVLVKKTLQLFKSLNSSHDNKVNIENIKSEPPECSNIVQICNNKVQVKPLTPIKQAFKIQQQGTTQTTSSKPTIKNQPNELKSVVTLENQQEDGGSIKTFKPTYKSPQKETEKIASIKSTLKSQHKGQIINFKNASNYQQKEIEPIIIKPTLEGQTELKVILPKEENEDLEEKPKFEEVEKVAEFRSMNFENKTSNKVNKTFANSNHRDTIIKGICKQAKRRKCLYMLVDDNENDSDVEYSDGDYCEDMQEEILEDEIDFDF